MLGYRAWCMTSAWERPRLVSPGARSVRGDHGGLDLILTEIIEKVDLSRGRAGVFRASTNVLMRLLVASCKLGLRLAEVAIPRYTRMMLILVMHAMSLREAGGSVGLGRPCYGRVLMPHAQGFSNVGYDLERVWCLRAEVTLGAYQSPPSP